MGDNNQEIKDRDTTGTEGSTDRILSRQEKRQQRHEMLSSAIAKSFEKYEAGKKPEDMNLDEKSKAVGSLKKKLNEKRITAGFHKKNGNIEKLKKISDDIAELENKIGFLNG